MTNYNDGNWHGWNGGECPVHPKTVVEAVTTYPGKRHGEAGFLLWGCPGYVDEKIVAFRVIEEHREPREWWVWESDGGDLILSRKGAHRAFKVREVIE